jgi:Ca2+-binding RTX toxin-like protein
MSDRFCLDLMALLEPRIALSISLSQGILNIVGTPTKDVLVVTESGDQIVVTLNGVKQKFAAAQVARVQADMGAGNDTVNLAGLTRPTSIIGAKGNDLLIGGDGNDLLSGGAGNDTLEGGDGSDVLTGLDGDDSILGGNGDDIIALGLGNDFANGGDGDDSIATLTRDQTLLINGSDGTDTMLGGPGVDDVSYFNRLDDLYLRNDGMPTSGHHGEDDVIGTDVEDLHGGRGDDYIVGDSGPNMLIGDLGNDTLFGNGGKDVLDGGAGNDLQIESPGIGKQLAQDGFRDTLIGGSGALFGESDTNLDLVSEDAAGFNSDVFDPLGTTAPAVVTSVARTQAVTQNSSVLTITGTSKSDTIVVTQNGNTISVNDNGVTSTHTSVSAISIDVGAGDDRVSLQSANGQNIVTLPATILGGKGNDCLVGGNGNDTIAGGDGDDTLLGGAGDDSLLGDLGNDRLEGGDGGDLLNGGGAFPGADGNDILIGGAGVDTADYRYRIADLNLSIDDIANDGAAGEQDNIHSDIENIFGGLGNDMIIGSTAHNFLSGGQGADTIRGGSGNDIFDPGRDRDTAFGGSGIDLFMALDGFADRLMRGGSAIDFFSVDPTLDRLLP